VTNVVRVLSSEELAAELAESRRRRAVRDEQVRAETRDSGCRYSGEDAHALGLVPPLLPDGTPVVLSKMTPPSPKRRKAKK
jgi:hypothetical protein